MRYSDKIGYELPGTLVNDVMMDNIVVRTRKGDVLRAVLSSTPSDKVNNDVGLQNRISIIADAWDLENVDYLRYVWWKGTPWSVTSVEVDRPRLILTLGGAHNVRTTTP